MEDRRAPTADIIEIVDENLKGGFAQLPRPVLRAKGLSFRAKLLYVALLDYAWQKGRCFPGHATLARDLDTSHDTIRRALQELREYGLISWKQQGLNKPNVYYLLRLGDCERLRLSVEEDAEMRHQEDATVRLQDNAELRYKEYSKKNTHTTSKYSKAKASVSKTKRADLLEPKSRGLTSVGAVLRTRHPIDARRATPAVDPRIADLITSWSAEWRDAVHLRSNLTQVRNIQQRSGWSAEAIVSVLYEAHATTNHDGHSAQRKMAYFFAVLKDLIGEKRRHAAADLLGA